MRGCPLSVFPNEVLRRLMNFGFVHATAAQPMGVADFASPPPVRLVRRRRRALYWRRRLGDHISVSGRGHVMVQPAANAAGGGPPLDSGGTGAGAARAAIFSCLLNPLRRILEDGWSGFHAALREDRPVRLRPAATREFSR